MGFQADRKARLQPAKKGVDPAALSPASSAILGLPPQLAGFDSAEGLVLPLVGPQPL